MAKISALPQKIKELALENQRLDQVKWGDSVERCPSESLEFAFPWKDTAQGKEFWSVINELY